MLPENVMWLGIDSHHDAKIACLMAPDTDSDSFSTGQEEECHDMGLCLGEGTFSSAFLISTLSSSVERKGLELKRTDPPYCVDVSQPHKLACPFCWHFAIPLQKRKKKKHVNIFFSLKCQWYLDMDSFSICSRFNICSTEQRWASFLLFHSKEVVTQHCQSAFSMIKTCPGSCWKMNNAREIACVMNKWQIIPPQLTPLHTVCKPVMLHLLGQGVQLSKFQTSLVLMYTHFQMNWTWPCAMLCYFSRRHHIFLFIMKQTNLGDIIWVKKKM